LRELAKDKNMYVVINGGGKIGEYLASQLLTGQHQVAIIEMNMEKVEQLAEKLDPSVVLVFGDGCDSGIQADAGVDEADIFISTTGLDDVNLVSCEIATIVHKVSRCIARVNNPRNEPIFRRVGIEAVSSTLVIANLIGSDVLHSAE
jgi:trk system potassium uptake protein TrkA